MSHIHLPDGILPPWLWVSGYLALSVLVAVLWHGGGATGRPRQFALLGIITAVLMLVMSAEVPPFGYHANLSVVAGILLGPRLAVLAALLVNIMLALIGHGGITVVGLNALVLALEMVVGWAVFRFGARWHMPLGPRAFLATVLGLAVGTAASFGLLTLSAPWIDRTLGAATLAPGEELGPGIVAPQLNLWRLAMLMFGIGAIGWVVEALLSVAILRYLSRYYPRVVPDGGA